MHTSANNMNDQLEQRATRRWRAFLIAAFVVLVFVEALAIRHDNQPPRSFSIWVLAQEWFKAVAPNIIASMITLFFAYLFVRENQRTRYLRCMHTIRDAIGELRAAEAIQAKHARALMRTMVPAISELYYGNTLPEITKEQEEKLSTRTDCRSCREVQPVDKGRCVECKDVRDSWEKIAH